MTETIKNYNDLETKFLDIVKNLSVETNISEDDAKVEAIKAIEMMGSMFQTPTTHFFCAQALEALGDDEKAMVYYHKILKNKKSSPHYIFDAANRLIELRKKLDAELIKAFHSVIERLSVSLKTGESA